MDLNTLLPVLMPNIVAIIAVLIAYKQNKDNIGSKRTEKVYEERLKAFSETISALTKLNKYIDTYDITSKINRTALERLTLNSQGADIHFKRLEELNDKAADLMDKFLEAYYGNKVFFSKKIDSQFQRYISEVIDYYATHIHIPGKIEIFLEGLKEPKPEPSPGRKDQILQAIIEEIQKEIYRS